jgi:hypothetical protein
MAIRQIKYMANPIASLLCATVEGELALTYL